MQTGDGLLARLVPAGPIPLDAFIGLCEAARDARQRHRWRSARAAACRSAGSRRLGPAVRRGGRGARYRSLRGRAGARRSAAGRSRRADRSPSDRRGAAPSHRRRRACARAESLGGRSTAAARIDLDALTADIRLRAAATSEGPRFHVALAGDAASATHARLIAPQDAVDAVLRSARGDRRQRTRGARAPICCAARDRCVPSRVATRSRRARRRRGLAPRRSGASAQETARCALGVGLAFGHAEAERPDAACRHRHGAWRALGCGRRPTARLLLGPLSEAMRSPRDASGTSGSASLSTPTDPRRRIVACPGAPACASRSDRGARARGRDRA